MTSSHTCHIMTCHIIIARFTHLEHMSHDIESLHARLALERPLWIIPNKLSLSSLLFRSLALSLSRSLALSLSRSLALSLSLSFSLSVSRARALSLSLSDEPEK
jgi:hypothetical protein